MDIKGILSKIENHYKAALPFVLYSLPESDSASVCFQNDSNLYNTECYAEECFVFAPFDYHEKALCIPIEKGDVFEVNFKKENIKQSEITISNGNLDKEEYCNLVKATVRSIKSRNAKKIVVSRKEEFRLENFDIQLLITRILNLYPSAFRYIWYHPKTGLWCGASPEVLVETEGASFSTMALAGTQRYNSFETYNWQHKEIEEQQIVVDEISTSLQKVTSVVRISKTYNHRAASLVHLRTDITGILKKGKTTLSTITSALHPTPAVCGTPQKFAKKYILEKEPYDREFYTGFLGPICEKESCSRLYVNLRCMKIENDIAKLFVGGGITIASIPENEWEETEHKLHTMLQVLQPML